MRRSTIPLLIFAVSCSSDSGTHPADAGDAPPAADISDADTADISDADTADTPSEPDEQVEPPPEVCGSGTGTFAEGLVELSWDDGTPVTHVGQQDWTITVNGVSYPLGTDPSWEAVRFELAHPALVHGFSVRWGALPEGADPSFELEAGLYGDFGHNGFDFWRWEPLWTGTRCLEDIDGDIWVDYVLPEPIAVDQPGLLYVAHHRDGASSPAFLLDGSTAAEGSCEEWDFCHSAMNLPEAQADFFYNGVSIQLPNDYLVRLFVEYTEQLADGDRIFQAVDGPTVGSRIAWGDYDGDGWDDYLTNGPRLWRNEGNGTFTDVTETAGIAALGITGSGGVWADYDNDGCLDVFVFAESYTVADSLLHSRCDGTFEDATSSAGIVDEQHYNACGDPSRIRSPSPAAAWADLDADGYVDLYVANFICWDDYTYYTDSVFHNEGDGTFSEWTAERGFSSDRTASRGVAPIDHDGDGDIDLLVNNYVLQPNLFFHNLAGSRVDERAYELGLAGIRSDAGQYGHTIGTAWGDIDNDGDFDVVEANLAHPRFYHFSDKTQVLMNDGTGHYTDNAGDWSRPFGDNGLRYQETHSSPVLADFDQDGNLDLVITAVYSGRPTDFYWGRGDGTFALDVYRAGITTENGWGAAVADIDHDGDLDLAASRLFENTLDARGHWLQVRVIGNVAANRAAIGATVLAHLGDAVRIRHVQGGTGQGCQDSATLHFGLGDATAVDAIDVTFPGGTRVRFNGPFEADQRLWLYEDGTVRAGWE